MPAQNSIPFLPRLPEIQPHDFRDISAMLTVRILKTLKERWTNLRLVSGRSLEPLDHPSLQAMSLRDLADLPLEPPPAAGHDAGVLVCNPGRAAADRTAPRRPIQETAIAAR
ncbi:hypothetical protein [Labrys sp. ZIDIC5]|uniref:hypothetical protein n=1 Tax=Labrys sedimenti TaxID=3106036 RepID=UPI002ACA61A0|nr:hypothetical protein [Labrys sp. ZIDIC5]MDZ5450808.1 hypothetical protein [Labrys sp. ZIDIC5]